MVVNVQLLREKIERTGMTVEKFSTAIGINPSTFYRKIEDGGHKFTVGQMHRTVEVLGLKQCEAVKIFLNVDSQ